MSTRQMGSAADGVGWAAGLARRGNRRRLAVFGGVFLLSLAIGQTWNFTRPDVFQASSRLQVTLPDAGAPGAAASAAHGTQLQALTSRPLLAKVAQAMAAAGQPLRDGGGDAASRLQAMLQVHPVAGSDVLLLQAVGEQPAQLAALLNSLPEVVRAELVASQAQAADEQLDGARKELSLLDKSAAGRRTQLERFRSAAGLQSERDENEAVARSKGLTVALNNAVEKEAAVEARLRSLNDGQAGSRPGMGARDDPTLTGMESRASQAREELRELERSYTPDFMAMDPRARALRARLSELERQIAQQRIAGQQAALQAAQQDQATAHATVERLRAELAAARPSLHGVSARFAEAKALEDDLAQIEKARRDLIERVARLEADQRRRVPTVTVLESATVPAVPFQPARLRDAMYVLAGSMLLALLAMALVELFNRAPAVAAGPATTTVVVPGLWGAASGALPLAAPASAGRPRLEAFGAGQQAALAAPAAPALLQQAEAAALLAAARGSTRWLAAAALSGLGTAELLALRANDIDVAAQRLHVRGAWSRELPLSPWLVPAAAMAAGESARAAGDASRLLEDAAGRALAEDDLQTLLACASMDAGLPQGAGLSLEVLRNTCIAALLDQGLRFSDLPAVVGRLDAAQLAAFAGPAAASPRRSLAEVNLLMPALRQAPPA